MPVLRQRGACRIDAYAAAGGKSTLTDGTTDLTEAKIAQLLKAAYQPGRITFRDGDPPDDAGADPKCAAVLVPFVRRGEHWELLFTRRTDKVETHKGQVSFPGGGCDAEDRDPEGTALREALEEIGLQPGDVRLLGRLNDMLTISGYRVTPVVGVIPWPYEFHLSADEVERVFSIPLDWLARSGNRRKGNFTPAGVPRPMPVIIYQPYEGELLWGISARITLDLLELLGLGDRSPVE